MPSGNLLFERRFINAPVGGISDTVLPDAAELSGQFIFVGNVTSSSAISAVVVKAPAAGTIDALPSQSLSSGESALFLSDGTQWRMLKGTPGSGIAAHHKSHEAGGSDEIKLDALGAANDTSDLNASTAAHGLLPKLPGSSTTFLDGNGNFSTPSSVPILPAVSASLGATPAYSGTFTFVPGGVLTPGRAVLINQAPGPYTGKGTRSDEAEMDGIIASAVCEDATNIRVYWSSQYLVVGSFRFFYVIGG